MLFFLFCCTFLMKICTFFPETCNEYKGHALILERNIGLGFGLQMVMLGCHFALKYLSLAITLHVIPCADMGICCFWWNGTLRLDKALFAAVGCVKCHFVSKCVGFRRFKWQFADFIGEIM